MTNLEACKWLMNLRNDLGDLRYESLWPYAQAIDDIVAELEDGTLLKKQEPRIITLEDFENNQKLDDSGHLNVWEEYRDGSRSGWNTINVNDVSCFSDIRRYWTDRPTEEQQQAVKWE